VENQEIYYRRLVEGYINKTLTKRELTVFFDLLSQGKLDLYLEEDMISNFPDDTEAMPRKLSKYYGRFTAAAVLVLLGFVVYFSVIRDADKSVKEEQIGQAVVQPGGKHAILTLSDGKQIILDSFEMSDETVEDNSAIVRNAGGSLKYDLSNLALENGAEENLRNKFHTIETPRGGTYHIILPDGSKVWLNSLSQIKFPLVFSEDERVIEMEGEVFFDVLKDEKRPFSVKSNGQKITVKGTSFNVNSYADEPFTRTTLVTGSIELEGFGSSIQMKPGDEVLNTGRSLHVQRGDIEQATAWRDGYFRFDKVDIPTLMRQVSRWYQVNVKYIGPISSERFVGKIKRSEDIHELLKIFNRGGMNVSLHGRTIVVQN